MVDQKKHENAESKTQEIVINDSYIGSIYAQTAVVTVTDIDITINFVYVNPRDVRSAQVVSRITLPRPSGEELANIIQSVVKMHEENKKEKENGTNS